MKGRGNNAFLVVAMMVSVVATILSCNSPQEHTAPAIRERDSVAMMTSYGVSTMISDSGVMKYRIISERWEVNDKLNPPRWIFKRGLFLEQFDEKLHIEAYVQADTAYFYNNESLWHLIGNVRVRTVTGTRFTSEELFWDQRKHELYSNKFSHLITPEREMQGSYFRSDEQLTSYYISNGKGSFNQTDIDKKKEEPAATADSTQQAPAKRQPNAPKRKTAV